MGAIVLAARLLTGCAETPVEVPNVYMVQPQDTLYSIAWRYGLDFRELARLNNIGSEYRISVGQALRLAPGTAATRPATRVPKASRSSARNGAVSAQSWSWPTDSVGPPLPVQGGGILLSGRFGQEVRAACAGKVVYAGNGIRGYGNLVIIKHGENLLSAYAHNRELLITEGQEVAMGQIIGHMGEGAPGKAVLYFEIRRNGKPINPLDFLPMK
jgi:murein DD-endopeptidase MepM/ murein hydrolase activator NlpD